MRSTLLGFLAFAVFISSAYSSASGNRRYRRSAEDDDDDLPSGRSFYPPRYGGGGYGYGSQIHHFGPYAQPHYSIDPGYYYQPYYKRLGHGLFGGHHGSQYRTPFGIGYSKYF
eukprot:TRINITY_DN23923_c0_g1_i1.p1 TRINITY_DN23923_c0_g1~~TRINITY_DN23923_c0_g1_i1.p1  ORF type:complete len:113 (+),score=21.51 TRINITY_DN23923_c0_g1_i1:3-341(+)